MSRDIKSDMLDTRLYDDFFLLAKIQYEMRNIGELSDEENEVLKSHFLKKEVNKREWVPVTEKLPEKGGLYFVTKENEYGKYVATEWFYQDKTWSTGWKVVAWMPMPKPYEEKG